jgi:CelD/BcsL family acetyltransferase involved in cellulose biosynthesis
LPLTAAIAGDLSIFAETIWSAAAALAERARRRQEQTVEVLAGNDAVASAAPAWRSIEQAGGTATPFQCLDFARVASEAHQRNGETPRIVIVRDARRPMVVFPTVTRIWKGVRTIQFLGDPLTQYGDIAAAPEATPAHIQAAWQAAADPAAGQFVYLRKVRADARIAPLLAAQTGTVATHQAPFVDVQAPATLNARDARELRRLRRRLAKHGEVDFAVLRGGAARMAAAEALSLKREWLAGRGLNSSVIGNPVWEDALMAMIDGPHACVARLSVGGRTAAIEIGLVHAGNWHCYLGALAPEFAKAGPGQIQMAETIAHCLNDGLSAYDLLAPADEYKRRITRDAVAVSDHAVSLGATGRFGLLLAHLVPVAKRFAEKLPPQVRRSLLRSRSA